MYYAIYCINNFVISVLKSNLSVSLLLLWLGSTLKIKKKVEGKQFKLELEVILKTYKLGLKIYGNNTLVETKSVVCSVEVNS